ncbi:MAG: hypothetical protein IJU40_06865 [Desulfovibrionaceae bacterium]|nr:hypothetical protein [Desulfovibrionaceae bacterium]
MDYESLLMGLVNSRLTKEVNNAKQVQEREDRRMPNSTRRAFESRMRSDAAVARVAAQNMEDGMAMVNIAQTNVTAIKSQFQEMQKILTECADQDSMTQENYASADQGLLECMKEIERLAKNASFNGMNLMDGSAGTNGVVQLQAGYSQRDQKFMNLLDGSNNVWNQSNNSMDLRKSSLSNDLCISSAADPQAAAQNSLNKINKYIDVIAGLEAQYSYDFKSLNNLSMLFEEQADIFTEAADRSSNSSTLSRSAILSQLLNASNSSILSGNT